MESRRDFIKGATATVLLSKSILGANDRINFAFIGLGGRLDTDLLGSMFLKQPDGALAAICDCNQARIDAYQGKLADKDKKAPAFVDYRRLLEKKDIDAVVIVTPDHLHAPIMNAAIDAGKDVYVEKPCSNTVEGAVSMLKTYRSRKQIVQLGTQQRSWDHFQEAAKLVRDGAVGTVNHILVGTSAGVPGGAGGGARGGTAIAGGPPPAIPAGLDWNLFLGPAKKVPYDPARMSWRGWYDYGGGSITDWGAHWIDIVHLAMGTDTSAPTYCTSVSAYPGDDHPNLERVPGSWVIEYKYPKFLMTQTTYSAPTSEPIVEGPTFLGSRGYIRVNRFGYIVRGYPVNPYAALNAGRAGGANAASRGAQPAPPLPLEEKSFVLSLTDNIAHQRVAEDEHVRNFFDCIKSRRKPVADFEIGFHSTLPSLLGRQSVKEGRPVVWDETTLTAKPA